ncbi:MAG: anhydro-N-acetylmuramic acid kinase [Sphingomonadales bacterium]
MTPTIAGWTTAIGLMSGTSMDGIDAALIRTDGREVAEFGPALTLPYDDHQRSALRDATGRATALAPGPVLPGAFHELSCDLARWHAEAVEQVLNMAGLAAGDVDVIGFHGQTLRHDPARGLTWQAGDGQTLADLTGIAVVNDFRSADVAAGGEGAPLAPLYHAALLASENGILARPGAWPVAVLNLGGVGNVTFVPGPDQMGEILAFDTGPANALIDDWMQARTGALYDRDGETAAVGQVRNDLIRDAMAHPYFARPAPKSLDRDEFADLVRGQAWQALRTEDGAATLTAFTVETVAAARDHLPGTPGAWYVTGGGRHNPALMAAIGKRLGVPVEPVEALGWRGDHIEAEAFACLAARSLKGLPLSLPGTTGVRAPVTGGRLSVPVARARGQAAR